MAETEVESILREIRERVLSQERAGIVPTASVHTTTGNEGNGASEPRPAGQIARHDDPETIAQSLALINSYLTTTARAWDRLPPLVSNRSGVAARLELWLKRNLKRATRWYAWEQVNFNAAVHHALRDMLPVLAAYEQELGKLRAEINVAFDQNPTELAALRAEIAEQRLEIEALRRLSDAQNAQVQTHLTGVVKELREREERLVGEQRVSFKQLALETTEAAVLEDRTRRKTEVLLEELTSRIEQLEAGKS